ncbi:MAG: phenylalanine--tRNA ligase subunit beta, partial [Planctomycetales bacterium]|nr:phenylalanine--tRNA ligase subunit beta [Planctomycetales bacterium]NIM09877.1 phenylalanine--tRNA ligase subunit beta [Planctomycetales bacterium]NIN09315.1 phenylalanine--tRNA ligase subunit beta [Planctomycetales bacterium]NIN78423.1 phenylalanine--tRNA ligase subunit beta [Planctomycetales bacterium]NIO35614.1 phenylalanine--tRNA ligase subunit beta [Planctomycetales bacterium]
MLVSWNWLKQYVKLDMTVEQLEQRLMMSGLNHEGTAQVGDDVAIDLEVTSNRPDCLGHIGVAREIAALYPQSLALPAAAPPESATQVDSLAKVSIDCPDLCSRYTARIIRGVKVGPSPDWLVRRLQTIGIAAINNVVDITNYVLMESGQPLHAFDLARLEGPAIIVRRAVPKEPFEAINHKTYELDREMCVIADARRPVALGGVMGGADTEVSTATRDLLIESALFDPISIRTTARKLILHSDSSYRFERGPDPAGVDWASRRCCELVLEIAGGELAAGVIDVGIPPQPRQPIVMRLNQVERVLGIPIDRGEICRILASLGNEELRADQHLVEVTPPSWRRDLQREIDLIEEVARIHGYDQIPEDAEVPMSASARSDDDRVKVRVRHTLSAVGFDEAMTASVVSDELSNAYTPWTSHDPFSCQTPLLRGATRLRRSLVPSLLAARRTNEKLANPEIELYEIAKVYLADGAELPTEKKMVALTSGGDFFHVKGALESVVAGLNPAVNLQVTELEDSLFEPGRCGQLQLGEDLLGFLGEVGEEGRKRFELRDRTTVAEIDLAVLARHANL